MNLILTRRLKEKILIGPDITVTVVQVRGAAVRLAVEAPADIKILREEVSRRIAALAAAGGMKAEGAQSERKECDS